MKKKNIVKKMATLALAGIVVTGSMASAMTVSPFASRSTGGLKLRVVAWFNSGYKTTKDDRQYGVESGKYINQCWVKIKEGDYKETIWSESYKKKQAGQGSATLEKYNNPFYDATLTWGWIYN